MKASILGLERAEGLRRFFVDTENDELAIDAISGSPEHWAWLWFRLREADEKPEWFPRGKYGTLKFIEELLTLEARESLGKVT